MIVLLEYQGTYHHGGEPFDSNNELHLKTLTEWKERSKKHINSDYKEAIRVWTIKDPLKRLVAKNNKLNKIIYNEYLTRFVYLEKPGCYSFGYVLLDREFNKIAEIPNGYLYGINTSSKNPVICDGRVGYVQYHEMAIVPYNKMIKKADEILGDYCPDEETLKKYNITKKKESIYGLLRKSFGNK